LQPEKCLTDPSPEELEKEKERGKEERKEKELGYSFLLFLRPNLTL
jgi:hypothetical protein